MTVLIVDDQISILSGLISGLDWDSLGVTAIRTAANARRAREILLAEPVNLLLCDIEMPGENGLSLLRWARHEGMDFVCVFLTSHADFLYAKEAIQLNCFDYILQPAQYEAIQATVARAIDRIRSNIEEKELEQYGAVARNNAVTMLQGIFSSWSQGCPLSVEVLCSTFRQMGMDLEAEHECLVILGQLLRWNSKPWPIREWEYAVNNIMAELYSIESIRVFPFTIDSTSVGWFMFPEGGSFQPGRELFPLERIFSAISQHLPCDLAFYVSIPAVVERLNDQYGSLSAARKGNRQQKPGIFCAAVSSCKSNDSGNDGRFRRWAEMLTQSCGAAVAQEVAQYLDEEVLDQEQLSGFRLQLQKTVINAAASQGLDQREIIAVLERHSEDGSLEDVKEAVREFAECFPAIISDEENQTVLIDRLKKYVEENLDRPLNVNDVAAAFFMNPDYISRQFKAKEGISLKNYIVRQKMDTVQYLLHTTNLPISVIAAKMGYDNFSYFSQVYRKMMGISPTDERK